MFEFKLKDKTVPLKWGTWSMKRFCEIKGITIGQYFDIIGGGNISLEDVIVILQAAAEMATKGTVKFTEFEVCEWIDEDGGIVNPNGQIKAFFQWIIDSHTVNTSEPQEEKKSPNE
jgi:hypothetical protein